METTDLIIGGIAGVVGGGVLTYVLLHKILGGKRKDLLEKAEQEGELIRKEKLTQAKEKFIQLKENHEKVISEKNKKIQSAEDRIKDKEGTLNKRLEDSKRKEKELESIRTNLDNQLTIVNTRQDELKKSLKSVIDQLEKVAGITQEDAKNQLVEALKDEARTNAMSSIK
ncbi:MAG: ribonuclease Y, partial [Sphingobacteriales bacterium]